MKVATEINTAIQEVIDQLEAQKAELYKIREWSPEMMQIEDSIEEKLELLYEAHRAWQKSREDLY